MDQRSFDFLEDTSVSAILEELDSEHRHTVIVLMSEIIASVFNSMEPLNHEQSATSQKDRWNSLITKGNGLPAPVINEASEI